MPAGRPALYKPEYSTLLIEHLSKGFSFESFSAIVKVNRDTLYNWEKLYPDFSDAKNHGNACSLLYWEEIGIKGARGDYEKFNASAWIFAMKNRFGWRDSLEVNVNVDFTGILEAARTRAAEAIETIEVSALPAAGTSEGCVTVQGINEGVDA